MDIDVATWDGMLEQTLEDRRLTKSERQALQARLSDAALDDRVRAVLRSRVFDIVRKKVENVRNITVVDWLEEVSKLLLPFTGGSGEPFVEAHFSPGEGCVRRICGMFDGARRSADVCVFTITDNRIAERILAAHRRGAAVRVVTDDDKAHDLGSDVLELARAGIPVRVDDSPYHMHHKFALFDEEVLLTGSYNWTRGAADSNEENLILSNDRRLLNSFRGEFERLWTKFASTRLGA
jgi:hypothetical protein